MNKKILLTTIIAVIAVGVTSAYAVDLDLKADTTVTGNLAVTGDITGPTVTALTTAIASASACPPENIQHWDKIMFFGTVQITSFQSAQPAIIDSQGLFIYDIKVLDDPTKVADLNQKVVDFLNPLGYGLTEAGDLSAMDVFVVDVDYSIVCTGP